MKAIQIQEFGGPEVMNLVELPDPVPAEGEVLVEISRAGVNFSDTHITNDQYVARQQLPLIPGIEFVGVAEGGRRVAAVVPNGSYAEKIAVPESSLVEIPDEIDDEQAAGIMIQGVTADGVLTISGNLKPGETVVVGAAAGGTGSLAVQLARSMGAGKVIGLASGEEKQQLVLDLGADAAVDSRSERLAEEVTAAAGGQVDVVLEMAGGKSFDQLIETLRPFGRMVVVGIATREQNELRTGRLLKNSLSVTGFWLMHLLARPDLARDSIDRVFGATARGDLKAVVGGTYGLSEVRRVHQDIAGRKTVGKLLLDPTR
ncbi:MAG TPA: NADPH:quinone oxidoreductase family protein [Solirubrobacterales bacterium]|nr:NADPH:quinone oxidoreductase family protein [Solirubrobacterales bacterium]HMX72471.1 NADPH:quinone oxidoreductase family protein [Solirubrobacterales bacterium]HMY25194.1 NADPH:quinone oxidoreductase family protein [Solirubrobacterales bacterium]HNA44713.1 NADPH:quinone oxidoreductase family protein [Solirubrobacterales bacterium]HNI39334.1 NADPH:quinone oxidoreductase family protein [Solirubrobacterales bacterium]